MHRKCFNIFLVFAILMLILSLANGQSNRHWTRNFNEESSLLAGAVVGGGAGPSSIYFNPASIAESKNSSFSINASLFSYENQWIKNALGDDINLTSSKLILQPRFISYLIQPKKNENFSIEFAYLNNEIFNLDFSKSVDEKIDILSTFPGEERYFALMNYRNKYRDDWVGLGTSWEITPNIYLGASMFASFKMADYSYSLDIEAFPDIVNFNPGEQDTSFYSANFQQSEFIHYNNYRLLWKFGILIKKNDFSFGLTIRTPSVNVYADGKRINYKKKQANITDPETGNFLPDYVLVNYKEKKNVEVDAKDPFSVAAGLNYTFDGGRRAIYFTLEYFNGLGNYSMIRTLSANEEQYIDYHSQARPILNAALGYRWEVKKNLLLMMGFRTDFNYLDRSDITDTPFTFPKTISTDVYHLSGGVRVTLFGQDLITGLQYSIGRNKGEEQIINLTEPLEYNSDINAPLQGTPKNNMNYLYSSLSIYLGATLNFN